jgi:putative (di)nucleoside polyphosphate hydrolase
VQIDADDHQEFSEWRWLPADELVANIVPFKRDVYARVVESFAKNLEM